MSGSNIICKSSSPPLVDIIRFDPLHIPISLTVLKRIHYREVSIPTWDLSMSEDQNKIIKSLEVGITSKLFELGNQNMNNLTGFSG